MGLALADPSEPPALLRLGVEPARAVCVLLHGRGQSPEIMEAQVVARVGRSGLGWLLPRASGGAWYEARALDPILPETEKRLEAAFDAVAEALAEARHASPGAAVVLAGFSQGGCVALDHALRRNPPLDGLAVLTGCRVGFPLVERPLPGLAGLPVYLACGQDDPWIPLQPFFAAAEQLARAGTRLTVEILPGRGHAVCEAEIAALAAALARAAERRAA